MSRTILIPRSTIIMVVEENLIRMLVLAETAMVAELPLQLNTMPIQQCQRQCQGMVAIMQVRIPVYDTPQLLHRMPGTLRLSMQEEESSTTAILVEESGDRWPTMHVQRMLLDPVVQRRSSQLRVNKAEEVTAFVCHGFSPKASCSPRWWMLPKIRPYFAVRIYEVSQGMSL